MACRHCVSRPNRWQARAAQQRHSPSPTLDVAAHAELGKPGSVSRLAWGTRGDALEMAHRRAAPRLQQHMSRTSTFVAERMLHNKERCPSCGLWKLKEQRCGHCISRPNRWQARVAQQRQAATPLSPMDDVAAELGTSGLVSRAVVSSLNKPEASMVSLPDLQRALAQSREAAIFRPGHSPQLPLRFQHKQAVPLMSASASAGSLMPRAYAIDEEHSVTRLMPAEWLRQYELRRQPDSWLNPPGRRAPCHPSTITLTNVKAQPRRLPIGVRGPDGAIRVAEVAYTD